MQYTFLLPVSYDSHYEKRIENLNKEGANIQILGFERNHYPGSFENFSVEIIGNVKHGKYFSRLPAYFKAFFKVKKRIKNTDIIYCFNIETLLIGWLTKIISNKSAYLVYDVADIREILIYNSFASKGLRFLEKFLVKKTKVTVVTAPAYITGYFEGFLKLNKSKFFIIENKVDSESLESPDPVTTKQIKFSNPITIGYFGVLRCKHSIRLLRELIDKGQGRYKLYLRGFFPDHLDLDQETLLKQKNVYYGGTFDSPEELNDIYSKIDLSWTAIHHYKPNIMWSRTNRFYQACYFNKPMIVQKGTYDADVAQKLEIGISIDLKDKKTAIDTLLGLQNKKITAMYNQLGEIPKTIYALSDEHAKLFNLLNKELK